MSRAPRGQGTVELALTSVVFVTVLLFGIHFAEVGYLSLKVQEAGAFAVWDSTGRQVQDLEARDTLPMNRILSGGQSAERVAELRYRDFNSLSNNDAPQPVTRALTRGLPIDVACREEPLLSARMRPSPTVDAAGVYFERGGFECSARARLTAINFPRSFLEGSGGLFKAEHRSNQPLWVCAVGRATGASCKGHISVLLNDWGMAGERNGLNDDCTLGDCQNQVYRGAVQAMWPGGGNAGAQMATAIAGSAPTTADRFWFSFAGEEKAPSPYLDGIFGEGGGDWNTGSPGIGLVPDAQVGDCFLGKPPTAGLPVGPGC